MFVSVEFSSVARVLATFGSVYVADVQEDCFLYRVIPRRCQLLHDAGSNGKVADEWRIGKNSEENDNDVIDVLS
jgi:hypothetical protein